MIENIISAAPENTQASFYRTGAGAEIDLLLELPNNELWAIDIKRSSSPKIAKVFYYAYQDLKPTRAFVLYSGDERFFLSKDVEAISLKSLLSLLFEMR